FGEKTAKGAELFGSEKSTLTKRFQNILLDLNCDKNEMVTEQEAERISDKFKFSFSKNKFYKLSKVLSKINSSIQISKIKNVDFNRTNKTERLFAGEMTEIKFGYRSKLESGTANQEVAGGADNLGGVYGNFKDEEDFCMLVFDKKIYMEKKDLVEHSSEDFLLARCSNPNRTTSLLCHYSWFKEEILCGELDGLELNMKKEKRFFNKEIQLCDKCSDCKNKISNSMGIYNIMIVGEYPSKEDISCGKILSSKYLWKELEKYGYKRKDFNLSSIIKGEIDGKSLTKTHINRCSKHIEREISEINPFLILAIGNTSLKYFLDKESGIIEKNGTTEWNDKANAWICWSINPNSIIYSPENEVLFKEAIKNFANKIKIIG
ncbi:MAG: uracil-DNA glycosylase family protein, partial [Methanogenium sp.]